MPPSPGDCVWVRSDKERPAIVLRRRPEQGGAPSEVRWMVVTGTGTPRPETRHVRIMPNERTGLILGLAKPTYFYATGVAFVRETAITRERGRCLPTIMHAIEELIGTRRPPAAP